MEKHYLLHAVLTSSLEITKENGSATLLLIGF